MCGIVGEVGIAAEPGVIEARIRRQLALLRHRGPDGSGVVVDPDFAFGHVRLAIIDLALGAQPFASGDGRVVVTYNGEIYNYVELREELVRAGHSFRTASDTEVLVNGYCEWGAGILERIDGMFAFALYDRSRRTLFCARDPYGQKPFFYRQTGRTLAFSSESRTFAVLPDFHADIDPAALADFLAFECLPFDRSIFRGVRKLPPGHALTFADGDLHVAPYFDSVPQDGPPRASAAELEEEVHAQLRASVARTFRADVPVGLLLSGGLDSSLVLALLREVHPGASLRTFTIRNLDRSYDESEAAALLAGAFGTAHAVVTAEPSALATTARELPAQLDEPQADPGILPKYLVCREIARTTKVALTGDGGDEFFYGYEVFRAERAARLAAAVPGALHHGVIRPLTQLLPASDRYLSWELKLKQFAKGFPAPAHLRNFYWTSPFPDSELHQLLRAEAYDGHDVDRQLELLKARWEKARGRLGRLAYLYQQQYLPDYVLANSDRAAMLHSVELRTPFLASDLVRLLNATPDALKMRGHRTKAILRAIARKALPASIARRPKIGFTAPVAALIKGELKEEVEALLGREHVRRQGLFDEDYVGRLLEEHFGNRHNRYKQIWVLFMLQKWLEHGKVQRHE
ncbi:MAG TPA: asparagine synthase (glutamine-hydrolyzing) [Gemmatimonadales bacterium]|nr:asparagine synthase (glutamine-hydrolyzing) [Gemmatimonadales bacterium]